MSELIFSKWVDGRQVVWDASTMEDAERCEELYHLKHVEGWRPKERSIAATWGTCLHDALAEYDQALLESDPEALDRAVAKALTLGGDLKESKDNARTPATLARAVIFYAEKYKADGLRIAEIDGKAALEVRFELAIPGTEYRCSGRLDALTYQGNNLFIKDRKTTKYQLNNDYFGGFLPGIQMPTYMWAAANLNLGVQGIIIEACQTLVNGTRFERATLNIGTKNIQEYEEDMVSLVKRIENAHTTGKWRRQRTSCSLYGGCKFRAVCNAQPSNRAKILTSDFAKVERV